MATKQALKVTTTAKGDFRGIRHSKHPPKYSTGRYH